VDVQGDMQLSRLEERLQKETENAFRNAFLDKILFYLFILNYNKNIKYKLKFVFYLPIIDGTRLLGSLVLVFDGPFELLAPPRLVLVIGMVFLVNYPKTFGLHDEGLLIVLAQYSGTYQIPHLVSRLTATLGELLE